MKLIVGLGNPGANYATTRHNIGFILLDALGDAHGSWRDKFSAEEMKIKIMGQDVVLLKPQTFMNRSGLSVIAVSKFYKIEPKDILVIHDELDLAPGVVKLKQGGGHAGHNGLRSIMEHIGGDFNRLRVGIGHPGDKRLVTDYVLHSFAHTDDEWIKRLQNNINASMVHWLNGNASLMIEVLRSDRPEKVERPERLERKNLEKAPNTAPDERSSAFDLLKGLFKK